ncbi:MAG: prepilin peptidase [bacterium]|nr:prepilin peptidase [bacterium]
MEEITALLFGLIFGSFLNVVIYRLPLEKSVVKPGSCCTACGKPVRFYDNIPVLSYIILAGKCRDCGVHFSIRYPLVEAFTGFSFWLSMHYFGANVVHVSFNCLFLFILIALAMIDYDHQILPDEFTLGGAVIFLIYSFFNPIIKPVDAIAASLGSALLFAGIYFFYVKVRKMEGMGFGDVKMMLLLGAFLGLNRLVTCILIASLSGLVVGLFFIIFKGKDMKLKLPFGTFLSLGAYASVFWGPQIFKTIQSLLKS